MPTAIFNPGQVVVTAALHYEIEKQGMEPVALVPYLDRHVTGDWGEVDPHDYKVNEQAVKSGARILSAYDMPDIGRIWIITDAAYTDDVRTRQVTTVMFPSDY
jgi:hypothetical protein